MVSRGEPVSGRSPDAMIGLPATSYATIAN
jgi:hypothetical protein